MHWWKRADHLKFLLFTVSIYLGISPGMSLFAQSVLASGEWYKLAVTQTGIHKIDFTMLRQMGIEPATIIPSQIRVFGTSGEMLSQSNETPISGLTESAILVQGEEDGRFDNGDVVYFYAEGPHLISYDSVRAELRHQLNYYSDTTFYFLNIGQKAGLRIRNANLVAASGKVINFFDDYWYHEQETNNLLKSGREWWGEYLSSAPVSLEADIPGVVPASEIKFRGSAIAAAQVNTRFAWQLNGETIGETAVGTVGAGTYDVKALRSDFVGTLSASSNPTSPFRLTVTHNKNGQAAAQGYLNYFALQVKRQLRFYDKQQIYHFLPQSTDTATYQFADPATGWTLWEISNAARPASVLNQNASGPFTFNRNNSRKPAHYIGFRGDQAFFPVSWQRVSNQDIVSADTPELLIITPAAWEGEAKRLAAFRSSRNSLETLVVTTRQVYHEISGGKPDVTAIRNYVRHLYSKSPGKLRYLLLFGDASFDYKNLTKGQTAAQTANLIPVYESRESLNPVYTYSSDDYFGFMEPNEGEWIEHASGDHTLEIGVGRLPVKSVAEAKVIVDKLIRYETIGSEGSWKNVVRFIADDGDGNIHQRHADQLAGMIENDFFSKRIFIDQYPQITTPEGQKAPEVNRQIRNAIDDGTLIINYTGHGGVGGWAEEQVLTLSDMLSARGLNNLPLLFTATCDFGRYDDPGTVSGAETMVLSPKGAAIGAISTTRPVFSSTNFTLSKAFYEALIKKGEGRLMGDFVRETKNKALVGSLNRNFTLLGDPSMRLGSGQKGIRWTQVPDTLRALQKVRLNGEIFDKTSSQRDTQFNGKARVIIYDKQIQFGTLGNEGNPESYSEFRSRLFDGTVTVKNGVFTCEFIMPKNIDYKAGPGRANVYAVRADSTVDAAAQLTLMIGGSAALLVDNTPPVISAYIDKSSFRSGDRVGTSPVLIARVTDENGVSLSVSGIGHDITLTVNDTLTIILNEYFTADLNSYQSGTIRYPFDNLPAGEYNVRLKVWDTYTNSSEIAFGFQVAKPGGIQLNTAKFFPNPFINDLTFELTHDRANEDVELILNILLVSGQRLGTFKWSYYNSEATLSETVGVQQLGSWVPFNVPLVYQLLIRSLKDSTFDQKSGKLIRSQ
ncbi:type IX secretion system sortase PorU [Dyadobacter crusticola]|uniref:type IX secretion system sortase PorU n=1 Tax=Dyadobacter crusticola TaxID=292407 RepID=UPI0004E0ED64|nr:type IX secretion system sortase PorU [Dyadobacter crusticola]